jgi:hypothetical protein
MSVEAEVTPEYSVQASVFEEIAVDAGEATDEETTPAGEEQAETAEASEVHDGVVVYSGGSESENGEEADKRRLTIDTRVPQEEEEDDGLHSTFSSPDSCSDVSSAPSPATLEPSIDPTPAISLALSTNFLSSTITSDNDPIFESPTSTEHAGPLSTPPSDLESTATSDVSDAETTLERNERFYTTDDLSRPDSRQTTLSDESIPTITWNRGTTRSSSGFDEFIDIRAGFPSRQRTYTRSHRSYSAARTLEPPSSIDSRATTRPQAVGGNLKEMTEVELVGELIRRFEGKETFYYTLKGIVSEFAEKRDREERREEEGGEGREEREPEVEEREREVVRQMDVRIDADVGTQTDDEDFEPGEYSLGTDEYPRLISRFVERTRPVFSSRSAVLSIPQRKDPASAPIPAAPRLSVAKSSRTLVTTTRLPSRMDLVTSKSHQKTKEKVKRRHTAHAGGRRARAKSIDFANGTDCASFDFDDFN